MEQYDLWTSCDGVFLILTMGKQTYLHGKHNIWVITYAIY